LSTYFPWFSRLYEQGRKFSKIPSGPDFVARRVIFESFWLMNRLLLFGMACLAIGCLNPGDCVINNRATVELEFVGTNGLPATTSFQSISVSGQNTPFLTNVTRTTVSLPLNPAADSTTFVFVRAGTAPNTIEKDSITFTYRNQVLVLNPDCGAILYHRDLDFSLSTFGSDALRITNRQLLSTIPRNATLRP
jgi:hypothetical protein